jgi:hypothetical protein
MTDNQRIHFYMPRFGKAAKKNGWTMKDCRLVAVREENEQRSDMHLRVWALAAQIAASQCRAIIPTDFRYAVNAMENNGKTSSKQLRENWRVQQCVRAFDVLRDPCLATWTAYLAAGETKRAGIIAHMVALKDDAWWQKLSLDRFDTRNWKALPDDGLAWLIAREKGWRYGKSGTGEDYDKAAESRRESVQVPTAPTALVIDEESGNPNW